MVVCVALTLLHVWLMASPFLQALLRRLFRPLHLHPPPQRPLHPLTASMCHCNDQCRLRAAAMPSTRLITFHWAALPATWVDSSAMIKDNTSNGITHHSHHSTHHLLKRIRLRKLMIRQVMLLAAAEAAVASAAALTRWAGLLRRNAGNRCHSLKVSHRSERDIERRWWRANLVMRRRRRGKKKPTRRTFSPTGHTKWLPNEASQLHSESSSMNQNSSQYFLQSVQYSKSYYYIWRRWLVVVMFICWLTRCRLFHLPVSCLCVH